MKAGRSLGPSTPCHLEQGLAAVYIPRLSTKCSKMPESHDIEESSGQFWHLWKEPWDAAQVSRLRRPFHISSIA